MLTMHRSDDRSSFRARRLFRALTVAAAAAGLGLAGLTAAASVAAAGTAQEGAADARAAQVGAAGAGTSRPSDASHVVQAVQGQVRLLSVGTVNLAALAEGHETQAGPPSHTPGAAARITKPRATVAPLRLPPAGALRPGPGVTGAAINADWAGNVRGAHGFNGLNSAASGAANSGSGGVGYVSPPDPALAVGHSPKGTAVLEMVNNALSIYTPSGKTLLGPVPAYKFFRLRASALLSDPRAYLDGVGHWFLTESVAPNGAGAPASAQYLAVSKTSNPLGSWAIYKLDTSDRADRQDGCPCFDNLAQLGVNGAALYISANQYTVAGDQFTGTVIYAVKVYSLYHPAPHFSVPPPVHTYLVRTADDSFGAYGLSPSLTVPGSAGNIAEYFVESDTKASTGSGLEVYALINPNSASGWPQLVEATVSTEPYSFPAGASQRKGPTPYGCSVRHCATALLDADFDAVQQAAIAPDQLYAELDTGVKAGSSQQTGVAWFDLTVIPRATSVSASLVSDGYVASTANILYPAIGVNHSGLGYMAFAVANSHRYPSAAYVAFDAAMGPSGPMRLATRGVRPLDDFTCYAKASPGHCRYGDYSAAVYFGKRIYMAAEYAAPGRRATVSNWSTRIWSAPIP